MNKLQHSSELVKSPEQIVVEYLQKHPDFFTQNPTVLATMEIPHERGAAVSLVERQLTVLREENQQLQQDNQQLHYQLEELIAIAKENEQLNRRIQRLIVALVAATDAESFFNYLYDTLHNEFHTDAVILRLFVVPNAMLMGRQEFVEYDAQVFALFEKLLSTSKPICGQLSAAQTDYLFSQESEIASAVLIPLGAPKPQGILAMGSRDSERFHGDMGTDLLKYMGELISHLLKPWLHV
ncbi:MAG: hypothetical protein BWK79_03335 [Beggiatoa sp. IS2]|nr:MAG: hypothetical protein BWK79_03335 [Beggiatoa sp. IS2]